MKKKVWAIFIGTAVSMALVACGPSNTGNETSSTPAMTAAVSGDEEQQIDTETPNEVETADESTIGNIEDGYDETKDYIGITLDGYKTTVSIYNDYSSVGSVDDYFEIAESYALDYAHSTGYPDASIEEMTAPYGLKDRMYRYTYITDNWEGIVGQAYVYGLSFPEEKYGESISYLRVCYDPKTDLIFIDNAGIRNVWGTLGRDYGPHLYADISIPFNAEIGYTETGLKFEGYIDYAGVVANVTGRGNVTITCRDFEDQNKLSDFFAIMDQYGIGKEVDNADFNYEYNLVK